MKLGQALSSALLLAASPPLSAQAPRYTAELLGAGVVVNDMNASGSVVGWTLASGVQAFVAAPGGAYRLLPRPAGYSSAWAQGINDAGVVVGSAATGGFPEFGEAVAWTPDGQGGYTVQFLGALPGHTQSVAYDVNNRGDVVGVSLVPGFQGGPTVWFNSAAGVLDLSALGAPSSPKEINDAGVIVGITGGLFDVDTLTSTPLPALPGNWNNFQGWAVNEANELAGKAFLGSQRAAAIWTATGGWQLVSGVFGQSATVQSFDINGAGVTYAEVPQPAARFAGVGTLGLAALIHPSQQGQWSFFTNLGGAVNEAGQIAAMGTGPAGVSGVVLLTPVVLPAAYCTAKTNSCGQLPAVAWTGEPSASQPSGFGVSTGGAREGKFGLLLYGPNGPAATPFDGGVLCVASLGLRRGPAVAATGGTPGMACDAALAIDWNAFASGALGGNPAVFLATVGQPVHCQWWARDSLSTGSLLSNGLAYSVLP